MSSEVLLVLLNAQKWRMSRCHTLLAGLIILLSITVEPLTAEVTSSYKGELPLPEDLYSSDGILLKKGKFEVEVRYETGHYVLVLAEKGDKPLTKEDKRSTKVGGETVSGEQLKSFMKGVPLFGTVRLESAQPEPEKENDTPSNPTPLPKFSWEVTLRAFEVSNKNEVVFVFLKNGSVQPSTTVVFRLFRNNPK
jgi:hypothetical protein